MYFWILNLLFSVIIMNHTLCVSVLKTIEYVIQHKLMKLFGFNTNAVALLLHLFHSLAVNCVLNCLR